ncbi:hypothetical protein [Trichormus sp. NMC-1]|uniref:hypothetical protein n=1 Tax=Trichormus sp. NMC-1 TaxID=1853259 RepID=UPI0008DBF9F3|nr:hypothetical protein [Trichormus sp. NMC-1]
MSEISNISTDEKLLRSQNDSATNHAEIVVSSELTELSTDEWRDRIFLERQVEKAFYAAAKALKELRDRRLYRSTHSTFENYCRSRFGFTHRHVNYLIAGSLVVDNLMGTNGSQILPTSEREYTVKIEHLKSLELLDEDCQFMQQLCLRLRRLHQIENRDSAVDWLCSGLGKQPKPYLSPLQSKLLNLVEQEYGLTLT